MSDLLYFFGNTEVDNASNKNKIFNGDTMKKSAKRPNTLGANLNNMKTDHNGYNDRRCGITPGCIVEKCFNWSPGFISPVLMSLSCSNLLDLPKVLPPENAKGNVEYKRQLLNLTQLRTQHLITQLKWRLEEGQGEAIYDIGVEDDGTISGLEIEELSESVTNLCQMAETLHASVTLLRERNVGSKKALEILIRTMPTHYSVHETKVAVLGNMDAGKSTLIGVLTQGMLDDGHGKTRLSTFRHIHEVRSGRTSSISCQLLGFDSKHNVTNYYWQKKRLHQRGHADIALTSTRLVSLIDLAGCWKYQRTTISALTSRKPHFVLLVISASHVLKGTTINHFQVSEALKLPIAIIITKTDRCSPDKAIQELSSWLQDRPTKYEINVVTTISDAKFAAHKISSRLVIPVFPASSVSGEGIDAIKIFLDALKTPNELSKSQEAPAEVWIDKMHCEVPRVNGCVVVGLVHRGSVYENDCMFLGPQKDGHFVPVYVHSIHRNRLQHYKANDSQFASFAVTIANDFPTKDENRENHPCFKWLPQSPGVSSNETEYPVQRGMVLLGKEPSDVGEYSVKVCQEKEGKCSGHVVWGVVVSDIKVLDEERDLMSDLRKYPSSWIVHCGNVYQKCQVVGPDTVVNHNLTQNLSPDDAVFCFNHFPQFIHCDDTFVFHMPHRNMKAHGTIKLLLGKVAFRKEQGAKSPVLELKNEGGHLTFSRVVRDLDYQSSDDEYVTAPSSPT